MAKYNHGKTVYNRRKNKLNESINYIKQRFIIIRMFKLNLKKWFCD